MADLALGILAVAISSLIGSVPWIAGVAIGWLAYRRRNSPGLRLALIAFASLIALQIISSVVAVFLFSTLIDLGWSAGRLEAFSDGVSVFFQLVRTGLIVLLAVSFFRLLQENHAAVAHQ